jgi:hypothetical protein
MNHAQRSDEIAHPKIRVALLLDDFVQPRWVRRIISDLRATDAVEIALLILNDSPPPPKRPFGRLGAWVRNRRYLLYAAYQRLDRWWFHPPNDPFESADIEPEVHDIPRVRVRPRMTKHCDYFESADIDAIRAFDLDVVLRFGFRILKGEALNVARYGIWSYHHGDNRVNRGGPAGFWEVMEGHGVTGSVLQRLTERLDDGEILCRTFSSTNPFSVAKNQVGLYWASVFALPRTLQRLQAQRYDDLLLSNREEPAWQGYSNQLYVAPMNRQMAGLMIRLAGRYIREKARQAFAFDQWFVAYGVRRESPRGRFVPDTSYHRFRRLIPPSDRFWADPFPVEHDGRRYIFIEEYLNATGLGRISVFEIADDGTALGPEAVLERPYHLSYPFVFERNGTHYMIPETRGSGQIELFRATDFPRGWVFDRVLVPNVSAVDATLAEINGRWWIFASVAPDPQLPVEELAIFHSESPFGPWRPHCRNPIKSDVRNSRPAGRIFEIDGRFYRPAQDCARRYGHSIVINEITELDPDNFREVPISRIEPRWTDDLLATHTINADGSLTVIDGQLSRRRRGAKGA